MGDTGDATSADSPAGRELAHWLNSSLCSCLIKSDITSHAGEDNHASEDNQCLDEGTNGAAIFDDPAVVDRMLTNGGVFQWLLHSFKPDLASCPSISSVASEEGVSKLQQTFKIAQEELGVQNLLLVSDLAKSSGADQPLDTLLLIAYLARFKFALGNAQPACPNWPSRVKLTWQFNMKDELIFLRKLDESPKCQECHETVLIMDRFLLSPVDKSIASNTRHRRCFRCGRCQKLLRIGLYRPTKSGVGYECLEHEREDLFNRLTPAPEPKSTTPAKEPDEKSAEGKVYPDLPKEDRSLYPQLAVPPVENSHKQSAPSDVTSSSPDLTAAGRSEEKLADQLSPPVPSRSRSSERDVPVPAPRRSLHVHGGNDLGNSGVAYGSSDNVTSGASKPSGRPERPAIPPKRSSGANASAPQIEYPEELNPFGDSDPPPLPHPTAQSPGGKEKSQNNEQLAVANVVQPRSPKLKPRSPSRVAGTDGAETTTKESLNPFGSDSESDDNEGKNEDNEDSSSLSSTNPFNESDDEDDRKPTRSEEDAKVDVKRRPAPPPRPPPPSRTSIISVAATKETHKKRPAPPPPSAQTDASGAPPPRPASPKKRQRKKRPAPPRPLPLKRQIRTESALSVDELLAAFEENEKNLAKTEMASVAFETSLRQGIDGTGFAKISNDTIREWVEFVQQKFDLVHKETELVYACRERQLNELHAEIEYQLRCLIEKPESEKASEDIEREAALLQRMLDIIEEKSKLADTQDEMIAQRGTSLPRNSIQLDDGSSGGTTSKSSTLDKSDRGKSAEEKQAKKKKKIKLRLKKLKQKIATSTLLHHVS